MHYNLVSLLLSGDTCRLNSWINASYAISTSLVHFGLIFFPRNFFFLHSLTIASFLTPAGMPLMFFKNEDISLIIDSVSEGFSEASNLSIIRSHFARILACSELNAATLFSSSLNSSVGSVKYAASSTRFLEIMLFYYNILLYFYIFLYYYKYSIL